MEVEKVKVKELSDLNDEKMVLVEATVNQKQMVFDVRVFLDNTTLKIRNVGIKTKRQTAFKYVDGYLRDDYDFRSLKGAERTAYKRETLLKHVPVEVLNSAMKYVYEQISISYY